MNNSPVFQLETTTAGAARVTGVISFANAAQVLAHESQLTRSAVDLDIGGLENPDSATLAVLIAWSAGAHRRGVALRYLHAPNGLRNLARLCEVEELLGLG
jgi:phospholipid transport system transporter-binding protein